MKALAAAKADRDYPIVSAASICAKVTRDTELRDWKFEPGLTGDAAPSRKFGCGYPGGACCVRAAFACHGALLELSYAQLPALHGALALRKLRELTRHYADADTKAWLVGNLNPVFGFPSVVRFSWATTKRLLEGEAEAVPVQWCGHAVELLCACTHATSHRHAAQGGGCGGRGGSGPEALWSPALWWLPQPSHHIFRRWTARVHAVTQVAARDVVLEHFIRQSWLLQAAALRLPQRHAQLAPH